MSIFTASLSLRACNTQRVKIMLPQQPYYKNVCIWMFRTGLSYFRTKSGYGIGDSVFKVRSFSMDILV